MPKLLLWFPIVVCSHLQDNFSHSSVIGCLHICLLSKLIISSASGISPCFPRDLAQCLVNGSHLINICWLDCFLKNIKLQYILKSVLNWLICHLCETNYIYLYGYRCISAYIFIYKMEGRGNEGEKSVLQSITIDDWVGI